MMKSDSTKELWGAFAKFRAQVKQPQKTANNPYFNSKYVTLEGVMQSIDAALPGTGLAYCQLVENCENVVSVSTLITHSSGEWMLVGPLTLTPTKRDPQGQGSAITYAKRYQLSAAFGISSDIDDDGNAGTFGSNQQGRTSKQSADSMDNRQAQTQQVRQRRQTPQQKALHDQATAKMEAAQAAKQDAANTVVDANGTTLLQLFTEALEAGKGSPKSQELAAWARQSEANMALVKRLTETGAWK